MSILLCMYIVRLRNAQCNKYANCSSCIHIRIPIWIRAGRAFIIIILLYNVYRHRLRTGLWLLWAPRGHDPTGSRIRVGPLSLLFRLRVTDNPRTRSDPVDFGSPCVYSCGESEMRNFGAVRSRYLRKSLSTGRPRKKHRKNLSRSWLLRSHMIRYLEKVCRLLRSNSDLTFLQWTIFTLDIL